jgi:hypothetical protein
MKKSFVFGLLFITFLTSVRSQITFTVKPGLNFNGANIGYKANKIIPYLGLQFGNAIEKTVRYTGSSTDEHVIKSRIYMPYLGAKFYIIEKGSLKSSINATVFKPVVFGKYIENGVVDTSFNDYEYMKMWGGELGFCSEYFFDEHFSIGGEFGYRFGFFKNKYEYTGSNNWRTDALRLNMTYISASLNYYF